MKSYKPYTKSRRHMTRISFRKVLTASEPHKALTSGSKRGFGRNNAGRITVRHQGGGHKRLLRDVDFGYKKQVPARIETVEYDPNRSGFIGLLIYKDGERRYALLPKSAKVGDIIETSATASVVPGNRMPLKKSRWVRLFTMLKLSRATAASLAARPVRTSRLSHKTTATPTSKCLQARCAKCSTPAGQRSARFPTTSITSW